MMFSRKKAYRVLRTSYIFPFLAVAAILSLSSCVTANSIAPAVPGSPASRTLPFDSSITWMRLHTSSNRVFNARNELVSLRGVNIASLEWNNNGDHVEESVNRAVQDWKASFIRLPLAQDRWFGKMTNQTDGGLAYRAIVDELVAACASNHAYIDLDLHWSDCGTWVNEGGKLGQHVLPDTNSIAFWRDVATRFKDHPNVIFGLYNEPHDATFAVWRDGGHVEDVPQNFDRDQRHIPYEAVGMQTLYDIVRAQGAKNLVTVSGLDWGYDLSGVLQGYAIKGRDFVYETHPYPQKKEWDNGFGDVSKQFPVYVGEFGARGNTNGLAYCQRLTDFIQSHDIQLWTAWDFHPQAGPTLLRNWSYEPTAFGQFVKDALAKPANNPTKTN